MCAPQECSPCALSRCSVTDNVRRKSLESIWGTATHSLSNNQCISTAFPFFNLQLTPSQSNCRASTDLPISLACHTACQSPQISRAKFNKVLFSTLNMLTAWLISLDRIYMDIWYTYHEYLGRWFHLPGCHFPHRTSKSWRRCEGSKHFWILLVPNNFIRNSTSSPHLLICLNKTQNLNGNPHESTCSKVKSFVS